MINRFIFFGFHFLFSVVFSILILLVVFFAWYPLPLAKAVGVIHIFLMMLAIDVIIGPLLGLLVYKEGKESLKMDLAIIILIQVIALAYGIYSIAQGRPAWLAYNVDRFELVRNNEIINERIAQANPHYQQPSWLKPQFVGVEFAKDNNIRSDDMLAEVLGGFSIAQRPERYVPLDKVKNQIQQHAQSLDVLNQFNDKVLVEKTLSHYPQATAFVPLKANAVDMTVLINKETGEVVKIVDLRPWK